MPLTDKGDKIMAAMRGKYGARAEEVFYASRNAGTITGVDSQSARDIHGYMDAVSRGDAEAMRRYFKGGDR